MRICEVAGTTRRDRRRMESASADLTAHAAKVTPPTLAEVPSNSHATPLPKTGGMATYAELRKPIRPSDAEIIAAIAERFVVSKGIALGWLRTMNLTEARGGLMQWQRASTKIILVGNLGKILRPATCQAAAQ